MKAKKAEDEHHDDDEADEIDYAIHFGLRVSLISAGFGEVAQHKLAVARLVPPTRGTPKSC